MIIISVSLSLLPQHVLLNDGIDDEVVLEHVLAQHSKSDNMAPTDAEHEIWRRRCS